MEFTPTTENLYFKPICNKCGSLQNYSWQNPIKAIQNVAEVQILYALTYDYDLIYSW